MSIFNQLAPTPPMGWNSWDCYGTSVREDEVKANADYMAEHLADYGWQYIVVDIQWYEPNAKAGGYRSNAELIMDDYGRLMPALNRFPSAAAGAGFRPLADYVHGKGQKFGLHILRGIPRQAVRLNLPVWDTAVRAQDIANVGSVCNWVDDMYGLDVSNPQAQAYYDSIVALYASWGVDYIKADDMISPYHEGEIEALSNAIQRSGRDIVLSLSPGIELSTSHANHLKRHSELWRISGDFWDRWQDLKTQFDLCKNWESHIAPNTWPDADMLPLGRLSIRGERGPDRQSLLTADEQVTLISLWVMFRSPLMFGGDLPSIDPLTRQLLTNREVLHVLHASRNNHELFRQGNGIVWVADDANSRDSYLALFNVGDVPYTIDMDLAAFGLEDEYRFRDLWRGVDVGLVRGKFRQSVSPHGVKLLRLQPVSQPV